MQNENAPFSTMFSKPLKISIYQVDHNWTITNPKRFVRYGCYGRNYDDIFKQLGSQ